MVGAGRCHKPSGAELRICDGARRRSVAVVAINGAVWLFGTASTEIWYETGLSGADAFAQMAGAAKDTGQNSAWFAPSTAGASSSVTTIWSA